MFHTRSILSSVVQLGTTEFGSIAYPFQQGNTFAYSLLRQHKQHKRRKAEDRPENRQNKI